MPRFHHGCAFNENAVTPPAVAANPVAPGSAAAAQPATEQTRFGFLFPELQNDADLLTTSAVTVDKLKALGEAMDDTNTAEEDALKARLPAIFTYFGQFVAHDITWEKGTKHITADPDIHPWEQAQVEAIVNKRSGSLDLDCVYGDGSFVVPRGETEATLKIEEVAASAGFPKYRGYLNDVPRTPQMPPQPPPNQGRHENDRRALIGDPRNDANTIISQLHVAFLRAHNNLAENSSFTDPQAKFEDARTKLIQLYQTIVLEDYLKRIIRPDVLSKFREQPDHFHKGFMPVEFSAAAFRFGHTMIRTSYVLNKNFTGSGVSLTELFGMPPGYYHHLPAGWIIEWEHFLENGSNAARQISTQLVEPLSLLVESPDNPFRGERRLAVRDLLRGYIFRIPTGQSVARILGVVEEDIVKGDDFERLVPPSQWTVLSNSEFPEKTPLWFYILAEAAKEKKRDPEHDYLGPVGSHLVAGVLMGLLFKSSNSILKNGTSPLGSTLNDLLRLAGVLPVTNQ